MVPRPVISLLDLGNSWLLTEARIIGNNHLSLVVPRTLRNISDPTRALLALRIFQSKLMVERRGTVYLFASEASVAFQRAVDAELYSAEARK